MSRRKRGNSRYRAQGVSGGGRVLPHRYANEGDKGPWFRRVIRRRETRAWKAEAEAE